MNDDVYLDGSTINQIIVYRVITTYIDTYAKSIHTALADSPSCTLMLH
jgi:hypothetical protein